MKIKYLIVFIYLFYVTDVFGAWEGPTEVVVGMWGSETGQFGFKSGDSVDGFPQEFEVDQNGEIVISDEINKRVQIFNASGGLKRTINKPADLQIKFSWPLFFKVFHGGNSILTSYEGKVYIFDYAGTVLNTFQTQAEEGYAISEGYALGSPSTNRYSLYSPTGALIRTTTDRPLELGKVKEKKTASGYTYTIQYPDLVNPNTVKTYTVSVEGALSKFMGRFQRDTNGNLYGVFGKNVVRFDDTGSITAQMQIPVDVKGERVKDPFGASTRKPIIEEYGSAVISPTGDVYTWKRTPDRYSIIKWTWRP